MSENFVEACLRGDALLEDVNDWVDRWHEGHGPLALPEHLGMTADEYSLWVEQPESLRFIVHAHSTGEPIEKILAATQSGQFAAAARAESRIMAERVLKWLRSTGRI